MENERLLQSVKSPLEAWHASRSHPQDMQEWSVKLKEQLEPAQILSLVALESDEPRKLYSTYRTCKRRPQFSTEASDGVETRPKERAHTLAILSQLARRSREKQPHTHLTSTALRIMPVFVCACEHQIL